MAIPSPTTRQTRIRPCTDSCDVDHYVGPLSAFAELFGLRSPGVYRVGTRVVSASQLPLPPYNADSSNIISPPKSVPEHAGHILLSITDLLPHIVDNSILDFDLSLYAQVQGKMAMSRVPEARKRPQKVEGRKNYNVGI